MTHALVVELVTLLCRIFSNVQPSANKRRQIGPDCGSAGKRLRRRDPLADLARDAHLSPNHLIRLFTRLYGVTPMRQLLLIRLGHARNLFATTELSVGKIAAAVGISDGNYFSRVFRRYEGTSPRGCRKACAETPEL